MFNDILDLLVEKKTGFLACHVDDIGQRIVSTVCDVLWYIDPHHMTFQSRGLKIPDGLEKFNGYVDWKSQHKKKPKVAECLQK